MGKLRISGCLALSALSACSLIYASDLNDADHGGLIVLEAGGGSAGGDGPSGIPTGDGGFNEAGPDAGPLALTVGCASYFPAPKFCDDFDDAATPGAKWDAVLQDDASALVSLDTTTVWSQPQALRTVLADAGSCTYSRVGKRFTGVGTQRQEVRLRLRPGEPWSKDYTILAINFDPIAGSHCQLLVDEYGDQASGKAAGSHVSIQLPPGNDDDRPLTGFAPTNEWTELYVVATPGNGGVQVTTGFAGGSKSGETVYTYSQCKLSDALQVDVGFHCDSTSAVILYDDVRVDWQ